MVEPNINEMARSISERLQELEDECISLRASDESHRVAFDIIDQEAARLRAALERQAREIARLRRERDLAVGLVKQFASGIIEFRKAIGEVDVPAVQPSTKPDIPYAPTDRRDNSGPRPNWQAPPIRAS